MGASAEIIPLAAYRRRRRGACDAVIGRGDHGLWRVDLRDGRAAGPNRPGPPAPGPRSPDFDTATAAFAWAWREACRHGWTIHLPGGNHPLRVIPRGPNDGG